MRKAIAFVLGLVVAMAALLLAISQFPLAELPSVRLPTDPAIARLRASDLTAEIQSKIHVGADRSEAEQVLARLGFECGYVEQSDFRSTSIGAFVAPPPPLASGAVYCFRYVPDRSILFGYYMRVAAYVSPSNQVLFVGSRVLCDC
jgi:hypothetical protein